MLRKAVQRKPYDFYHLISADSFVTRPMKEVLSFFADNPDKSYVEVIDLQKEDSSGVIKPWYQYYHFLHLYNKRTAFGNWLDSTLCRLQKKAGIKRKLNYRYKGLFYCHLTQEAAQYVLSYVEKNPGYMRNLKFCNIGEEFFFQNLLMDSPLAAKVIPVSLFYCKWNSGGVSQNITEDDKESILNHQYLFARKFGLESEKIYTMIKEST